MFIGQLGEPVGVACYKPYHSYGERLLHEFIGMCGVPLDPYPYYPANAKTVFLTADAAWDKEIVSKIKQSLLNGSKVFITSGLYEKLAGKGIEDILPIEITNRKITTDVFTNSAFGSGNIGYVKAAAPITLPHVAYNENDIWPLSAALTPHSSHALLLCGAYGKGSLYVLTIPDSFADLYNLPAETLAVLRRESSLPVTLESCGRISLFPYNNDTFILQSFLDRLERVRVRINRPNVSLVPLMKPRMRPFDIVRSGDNESVFDIHIMPGHYMVFRIEG